MKTKILSLFKEILKNNRLNDFLYLDFYFIFFLCVSNAFSWNNKYFTRINVLKVLNVIEIFVMKISVLFWRLYLFNTNLNNKEFYINKGKYEHILSIFLTENIFVFLHFKGNFKKLKIQNSLFSNLNLLYIRINHNFLFFKRYKNIKIFHLIIQWISESYSNDIKNVYYL